MPERTAREILEDVAAGRLDPAEAARQLDEVADASAGPVASDDMSAAGGDAAVAADRDSGAATAGDRGSAGASGTAGVVHGPPPMATEINRLMVRATSRRVRLVADPMVTTVAVDGPHVVRRDGSTLVVTGETEIVPTDDAFMLLAGGRWREVADRLHRGVGQDLELKVRVRPDLATGVEVIAGSLQVDGLSALDHVRVTAGSLRVRGAERPIDLLVQAGSAQVETRQTYGRSRLRCESGSMQLTLLDGSDVRVRTDVQLGRVVNEPERRGKDRSRDLVLGTGAAEIDLEVVMGSVTVRTPDVAGTR